ncbi:hypothetical protein L218DRAFT_989537 [Marasmius fiardii PR-910]|nr:hypothetical protein L218DRAFT_989537 [Marasmius fiardii PR-910]
MFSIIPRIGFLVLLLQSCAGLEIDIPPSIFVEKVTTFHWECDTTDVDQGLSGAFAALLISPPEPPENFSCLNLEAAGDQDTLTKLVQSYSVHLVPSGTKAGVFLLTPKSQGKFVSQRNGHYSRQRITAIKISGNSTIMSSSMSSSNSNSASNPILHSIISSVFLNQSTAFPVLQNSAAPSRMTATANTTFPPSATFSTLSTANSGMQNGTNRWKGDRQKHHDSTAALVGGVMGVVLLIAIILATIFYRRLRYQRKLNQFQKEHLLLHQRPPSSMSVQRSYQFSTGPHSSLSPPSYSPALSNEPEVLSGVSKQYPADSEKQQA